MNVYSAAALNVADRISDPVMPDIDPSVLDFGPMDIDFGMRKDDPLNWTSQSLLDPVTTQPIHFAPENNHDDEDDMHIELELDLGDDDTPNIEIGRKDNGLSRPLENEIFSDDDKQPNTDNQENDFGNDDSTRTRMSSMVLSLEGDNGRMLDNEVVNFNDANDLDFRIEDDLAPPTTAVKLADDSRSSRDSQSPLSSVPSQITYPEDGKTNLGEEEIVIETYDGRTNLEEEEISVHQAHKAKKRRILQADTSTVIPQTQIKQQQADRSAILKPVSFLSRDPILLNLINLQRNGGFVSSIMGDGRAKGWAPELRGILSIEVVRKSGELKRKRDSGVADLDEEQANITNIPQLEIPEDNFDVVNEGVAVAVNTTMREPSEIMELPTDNELNPIMSDHMSDLDPRDQNGSDDEAISPSRDIFDETTAPLLHPSEQGAISIGTQHAVHLLRDRFKSSRGLSQPQSKKSNILFQEILPETTTSKADATKIFFEVLVLATKDAVKVDQPEGKLGGPLRIRGKRGLWGAWAEKEADEEIVAQDTATSTQVAAS